MNFYKVGVSYKGTNYLGWQVQNQTPKTIQGEINRALIRICQSENIKTLGSSRTDAGVHAMEQIFRAALPLKLPAKAIVLGLNSYLPADIRILHAEECSSDFHPVGDAKWKEYLYFSTREEPSPFEKDLLAYYSYDVNFPLMREAANLFLGKHDFKSFQCTGTKVPSTIREITEIELSMEVRRMPWGNWPVTVLRIRGDGFLKQMVRLIMGALWSVGREKITLSMIQDALDLKSSERVGFVAPPCGLFLHKIHF